VSKYRFVQRDYVSDL